MTVPPPLTCTAVEQQLLLDLAHKAIRAAIHAHPTPWPARERLTETLRTPVATFVTLKRHGQLRGCVGNLTPRDPLYCSVANNAVGAALRDSRFPTVTEEESESVEVHISVLSELAPTQPGPAEERLALIQAGQDGVVLRTEHRSATFLPQVWEMFPDKRSFLEALSKKAGLDRNAWQKAGTELLRYRVTGFGDPVQ